METYSFKYLNEITVTYKVAHKITQEMVDDLLCAAFEGGINYWSTMKVDVVKWPDGAEFASEALSRGSDIRIHDDEEDRWCVLTLDKFIESMIQEASDNNWSMEELHDNHDACTADNIVQRALFGEVIYG